MTSFALANMERITTNERTNEAKSLEERKYYKIIWKSVAKNFVSLLKNWPRPGKYVKFYVYDRKFKKDDFTHIDPETVEFAVQGRNTYLVEQTPSSK